MPKIRNRKDRIKKQITKTKEIKKNTCDEKDDLKKKHIRIKEVYVKSIEKIEDLPKKTLIGKNIIIKNINGKNQKEVTCVDTEELIAINRQAEKLKNLNSKFCGLDKTTIRDIVQEAEKEKKNIMKKNISQFITNLIEQNETVLRTAGVSNLKQLSNEATLISLKQDHNYAFSKDNEPRTVTVTQPSNFKVLKRKTLIKGVMNEIESYGCNNIVASSEMEVQCEMGFEMYRSVEGFNYKVENRSVIFKEVGIQCELGVEILRYLY